MGQTLAAEIKYAPAEYQSSATYSPLYTNLALNDMNSFLNGSNGKNGYLGEYANQIMPTLTSAQTQANTQIRSANLADAAALTPQYVAEERAANPGAAGLLDTLTSNTNRDLSYGTNLTPAQQVQFNQSVRGGEAARGLGFGPSDVFNESLQDSGYGQQLYQQRMQAASSLVPQLQGFYGDPTAAISGMQSNAGISAGQAAGAGSSASSGALGTTGSMFNPANAMAQQYNQNTFQGNLAEANAYNGAFTQGAQSGMSAGSGMMSSL
jgi:hypothetical protein